jgi:hypothetical protein
MHPHRLIMLAGVGAGVVLGCSGPRQDRADTGHLTLALRTGVGDELYELRDATFDITGPMNVVRSSQEAPDATAIEQELPVGEYSAELQPEWRLFLVGSEQNTELAATLLTENPVPFSISAGATTEVSYGFEINASRPELGAGVLQIGIDVIQRQAESVVFTELMYNPAELADSAGEWFELENTGEAAIELNGCVVERDGTQLTVNRSLELAPGQVVTFANGDAPGFVPDYVYSGLTLPNSAEFRLSLHCGGELLDTIAVDPGTWPGGAGISTSLSAAATSATANDDSASWCAATAPYNTDLGTPGSANPVCG